MLAVNLRRLRAERNQTQLELAVKADVSPAIVGRVEKGYGCRLPALMKIAEALNVTLNDMVYEMTW